MKKKRLFNLFYILLLSIRVEAQAIRGTAQDSFAWQANLDTVHHAAFYKIILTPD